MEFERNVLILRLFCAIFLTLIGGAFLVFDAVTTARVVGAVFAGMGLTALYLVWLGRKSQ